MGLDLYRMTNQVAYASTAGVYEGKARAEFSKSNKDRDIGLGLRINKVV